MGSNDIRNEILEKVDTVGEPDYIAINVFTKYGSEIVNKVAGLAIVTITILLVLIIAIELAYLVFGGFRGTLDKVMIDTQGMKKRVYELVLHDAKNSYREYIECGTNKNLLSIYLKRKLIVIFIYGIIFSITVGYGKEFVVLLEKMLAGVMRQIFKVD